MTAKFRDNSTTADSLSHQFLVSMPSLNESFFDHAIILITRHDEEGAMGLIINHPLNANLADIYKQLNLHSADAPLPFANKRVLCGGPVQTDRGFVLHNGNKRWANSLELAHGMTLTASPDILEDIAAGIGPDQFEIMLGYSGWHAGQLEEELANNSWLNTPIDTHIIFETPIEERWRTLSQSLGINPDLMPSQPGHA